MLIDFLEQTVYTQEGVLRGCANLTGSYEDAVQYKTSNSIFVALYSYVKY